MYIEIHDNLGRPQRINCNRVVVYDAEENPVALAVEYAPRAIMASTCEHEDFNLMLQNLGIAKTVIMTEIPQIDLRHVRFGN